MKNDLNDQQLKAVQRLIKNLRRLVWLLGLVLAFLFYAAFFDPSLRQVNGWISSFGQEEAVDSTAPVAVHDEDVIEGIHVPTGLIAKGDYSLVAQHCTGCHSAQLVTQNRMTDEGWKATIRWMQETQNLWDLGANEELIVAYLSTYYAPKKSGRRAPLKVEEWYTID